MAPATCISIRPVNTMTEGTIMFNGKVDDSKVHRCIHRY